jgi:hypothetical protein
MSIWITTAQFHLYGEPYIIAFKSTNLYRIYIWKRTLLEGKFSFHAIWK